MAGYLGKIGEFDSTSETWPSYVERLEHFFNANKVGDDQKKDALLACMGKETFGLLRALVVPTRLKDKTFGELVETLRVHLAPKPLVIAERFQFYKRDPKETEGIKAYAASLKKLAEHCDFGDTLPDALRDRLVCGMRDGAMQKRLLGKADLTFVKALEVAELEEMAARDAAQLHEGQPKDVHRMSGPPRRGGNRDAPGTPTGPCYHCGRNHLPNQCRFRWERCRFCKLQGHAERVCRKKMKAESMREASGIKELKGDSRSDTEDSTDGEALHGMEVSSGNPLKQWKAHKPMYVQVIMEGQPIKMELDTGAAVSIMPYTMYKEKMAHIQLRKSTVNLKTYTGQRVRPLGEITVQVARNGTVERLKLVVVDGLGPPLMGRYWLSRIPIDWGKNKVLRAGDEKQSRTLQLKRLLEKYPGIQKDKEHSREPRHIYH